LPIFHHLPLIEEVHFKGGLPDLSLSSGKQSSIGSPYLLGHASIATTATYLARMEGESDNGWDGVATALGVE
jgi:hypothetical protein